MRDAIRRRRTRIDEVQVKGPSRELARLQMDTKERTECQPNYGDLIGDKNIEKSGVNSIAGSGTVTSMCVYCAKTFERRAALITHTKSCPQKAAGGAKLNLDALRNVQSGGNASTDSKLLAIDKEEESSNSADNFLTMLNHEKRIQATVQAQQDIAAKATAALKETTECVPTLLPVSASTPYSDGAIKNKRKRNRVRKTSPAAATINNNDDISWTIVVDDGIVEDHTSEQQQSLDDQSIQATVIKSEPDSIDSVINSVSIGESGICESDFITSDNSEVKIIETTSTKIIKKGKLSESERTTDCTICDKKFANISNLRRHVSMFHYREKKFGCKLCEFKAFRKIDIINHLGSTHDITGDKDVVSKHVALIEIDKNKFNDEKVKAIAKALVKYQQDTNEDIILAAAAAAAAAASAAVLNEDTIEADIIIPLVMKEDIAADILSQIIPLDDDCMVDKDSLLISSQVTAEIIAVDPNSNQSNVQMEIDDNLSNGSNGESKRRGRPKGYKFLPKFTAPSNTSPPPTFTDAEAFPLKPIKNSKLSRNSSSNSSSSEECNQIGKRPVRNRIKTVNKDFVYDLSDLLKKEAEAYKVQQIAPVLIKSHKRKLSTIFSELSVSQKDTTSVVSTAEDNEPPAKKPAMVIRGAALIMAQLAVLNNKACFNKPPEIPSTRPIVPAKIIALRRSDGCSTGPVIKTPPLPPSPSVDDKNGRRLSNEKLFDALTKKKQLIDKLNNARIMEKFDDDDTDSPNIRLLVNGLGTYSSASSINGSSCENLSEDDRILVTCATDQEFQQYLLNNGIQSRAPKKFSELVGGDDGQNDFCSPSISPPHHLCGSTAVSNKKTKRITLMQRIAENKTKKIQENLLKLHIGSGSSSNSSSLVPKEEIN